MRKYRIIKWKRTAVNNKFNKPILIYKKGNAIKSVSLKNYRKKSSYF